MAEIVCFLVAIPLLLGLLSYIVEESFMVGIRIGAIMVFGCLGIVFLCAFLHFLIKGP